MGSALARDVRSGLRSLRRTPAFTIGAIVTVALAVGATTAIFSVVYAVLLRQVPYRDVERVFWMWSDQPGRDRSPFNVPDFIDYRDRTQSLDGLAGFLAFNANLSDDASPERVQGIRATGNFFDVLGVRTRLGRPLQPGDEQPGAGQVVVLTEPFWMRRFGGDANLVGRTVRLNSEAYTVVGVLAAGFVTPIRDVEFAVPFAPDLDPRRAARNSLNFIQGVARLRDDVSRTQATGELTAIAQQLRERFPVENARKRGVRLTGIIEGVAGEFRTALLAIFAAVGALLLVACSNLANLMLTRANGRRKETAVRLALGSSRLSVIRQCLVEAVLLGVSGGLLGALLAHWGVAGLVAMAPAALPRGGEIAVDATVLVFSCAVSLLTGILFGTIPALLSARVDIRDALHGSGRGSTAGGRRIRGALVSCEVAIAMVLLIVMVMLAKSFAHVQAVSPGFDPAQVLSARLALPAKRFDTRESIVTFQRELAGRVSALPTVTHTGAITILPLTGLLSRVPFTVEGRAIERERVPLAQFRFVSPGYFDAARIPLKRGRVFSERDSERTQPVAVINEALADQWLEGLDPIGARLLVDDSDGSPRPVEVIGIVGNVQQIALDGGEPTWDLYLTYSQIHRDTLGLAASNMFWIARTASDPMRLADSLAREVRRADPEVVASQIRPMDRYLSDSMAPRRFSLTLMTAFAVAALAVAIVGVYAVIVYSVGQRAREIGIRVVLGAGRWQIIRVVMAQGVPFVAVGICAGLGMALGLTRLLAPMLFGVPPMDVASFSLVAVAVALVSIVACAVPTRRALASGETVLRGE